MDNGTEAGEDAGVWLSPEECKTLFSCLRSQENLLLDSERDLLLRMEKILYRQLSIEEMEALQHPRPRTGR